MKLGAFSLSLNVADLVVSKTFYEKLGFKAVGGDVEQGWLIMRNGDSTIGLFQGMFDSNIMTFNPGWDAQNQVLSEFDDVRVIQKQLKSQGVDLMSEADESSSGPGSMMLTDPDGNVILIDQHV
ncbi:VOC family protein [Marinicella rhabdoformis]|uniref:VOC family protein n=1 Tax=Marinicella rhabdoformis TaxID=2580566 RepID=UPI0015D0491A